MWARFDRRGRYAGYSRRVSMAELGCLPVVLLLVLLVVVFPVVWPLVVFGSSWAGIIATVLWDFFLIAFFIFVIGRPPRTRPVAGKREQGWDRAEPDPGPGPRDWTPLDDDDGRRLM